jgi:serine/threonine protein phosphatase PrpC
MDPAMTTPDAGGTAHHAAVPVEDRRPSQRPLSCPTCSAPVAAGERYCEACGADLGPPSSSSGPVQAEGTTGARVCRECGGAIADDGYCTWCGAREADPRHHFTEQPAAWVAGVCDRGVRHARNEDAVALDASPEPGGRAVLVVCDGVSSSTDSDVASLAAARAARDVLAVSDPQGMGTPATRVPAIARALVTAADAANQAVIAHTTHGAGNPASCTFVAAVLHGPQLVVGWVGDSRTYWLPDAGRPRLLTTDDSFAAEQIADGVPRADAETGPGAHAITRWLGSDAPDHTPRTVSLRLAGPGWVVVCSDGLWNYCSEPGALAAVVRGAGGASTAEPLRLATSLVDWANAQGGHDNVTVALARVDALPTSVAPPGVAASSPEPATDQEEVQPDGNVRS